MGIAIRTYRQRQGFDRLLPDIFRMSSYLGLFPFRITSSKLSVSSTLLVTCTIPLTAFIANLIYIKPFNDAYLDFIGVVSFAKIVYVPFYLSCLLPVSSSCWMIFNVKKFNKMLNSLSAIENSTHQKCPDLSRRMVFFISFVLLSLTIFIWFLIQNQLNCWPLVIFYIEIFLFVHLLVQFISIIDMISFLYDSLIETLNLDTASVWVRCHEVLGACCHILMDCYSPHLLVFFLLGFSNSITTTYTIVISIKTGFNFKYFILHVSWILVLAGMVYINVDRCSNVVTKERKFDRLLYRLALQDQTMKLLRDKRIINHFIAKPKVEFSAMGLFKYDYRLITYMISITTTYSVIMVPYSS